MAKKSKRTIVGSPLTPALTEHCKLLAGHEGKLDVPSDIPNADFWRTRG